MSPAFPRTGQAGSDQGSPKILAVALYRDQNPLVVVHGGGGLMATFPLASHAVGKSRAFTASCRSEAVSRSRRRHEEGEHESMVYYTKRIQHNSRIST